MKTGQLIDVTDKRDSVDTFESYFENCFESGDNLILPVVNLLIIDEDVAGNLPDVGIEYAYLVLTSVNRLSWIGETSKKEEIIGSKSFEANRDNLIADWFAFHTKDAWFELKTWHHRMFLYVPTISRFGRGWWSPRDTPNRKQNMDDTTTATFWGAGFLPAAVCEDLKLTTKPWQKMEFGRGTDEEVASIRREWSEC